MLETPMGSGYPGGSLRRRRRSRLAPVASPVTMPLDLHELVARVHTALVLQEVQNGVVGEESALPILATEAKKVGVVGNCAELARAARAAAVPVVHCTAETRADRKGANRNARLVT